jgi:hypothetical protein
LRRDGRVASIRRPSSFRLDAGIKRPASALSCRKVLYKDISSRRPDLLHPNAKEVAKRPWGAQEFAVLDKTGVCVIFRQW